MSRTSILRDVLGQVVAGLEAAFATKDVSEDARMLQAHPDLAHHSHYHAFVGGALSDHRAALEIVELRKNTSRGSVWQKEASLEEPPEHHTSQTAERAATASAADAQSADALDLGPQRTSDSRFAARMRIHQSWYRAHVLGLPYGTGPTSAAGTPSGTMLTRDDGAAGRNFLTPEIARVARERVAQGGGAVEPYRLFHNMLSSQPMCFNLFGPLAADYALAARLLAPLLPEGISEVTSVALEWAPDPASEYLDDGTAFDAYIEYRSKDGRLCALGIETKLTEPFSQREYDRDAYRRWMGSPDSPWRADAERSVQIIAHNQLWRDHLLAVAMKGHAASQHAIARLLVVRHPEDHDCERILSGYRKLLHDGDDSLLDLTLNRLIDGWAATTGEGPHSLWLREFRLRYLALERSSSYSR
jgi:hypothetical protein